MRPKSLALTSSVLAAGDGTRTLPALSQQILHRSALLLLSALALIAFAGSVAIIPFVGLTALGSYAALAIGEYLIGRYQHLSHVALWVNAVNWTFWIGLFVTLELTGVVGTLTGNSATLADQWLVTLGLPFYVLSMAAANSDVLLQKRARPSIGLYLLYVMYFPKFLSGPIEKPGFIDTLQNFRFRLDWQQIDLGGRWILIGVFYKMLIGRYLAKFYFPDVSDDFFTLAFGVMAFELRVYFDLCGYSLMAYGMSMMLGIPLTLNFNHPFFAGNIRDFWRCWHISLGRWFNEYVYEPLRRHCKHPQVLLFAPALVFLCSAAWHGITANFLFWGLFHALAFIAYTKVLRHHRWSRPMQWLGLFGTLAFGRLLFMDADLPRLLRKIELLFDPQAWLALLTAPTQAFDAFLMIAPLNGLLITATLVVFAFWTESQNVKRGLSPYSLFLGWRRYVLVLGLILLASSGNEGMIYARQ